MLFRSHQLNVFQIVKKKQRSFDILLIISSFLTIYMKKNRLQINALRYYTTYNAFL